MSDFKVDSEHPAVPTEQPVDLKPSDLPLQQPHTSAPQPPESTETPARMQPITKPLPTDPDDDAQIVSNER